MSIWKILIIVALVGGLAGYGMYQQRPPSPTPAPTPDPTAVASGNDKETKLKKLIGTQPNPWSIPAEWWANTKAPITRDDLKGHVAVVEFWRTGCSHCEEAVPVMNAIHSNFSKDGVKIVAFQSPGDLSDPENPETKWPEVQKWMKERQVNYPVAFDDAGKLRKAYNIELFPMVFVLDREGKIRYANTGHDAQKAQALMQAVESAVKDKK